MTARSSTIAVSELNVTPMLDVLLVLLIIFMAMSIRMHRTIDVLLPQACTGVCEGTQPIVLEVLPGPAYRINRTSVPSRELQTQLTAIYRDRPEKIIQVAGYPGVRYDDVTAAMDIAKSSGVRVVGIASKDSYLRR
jgi:biopolymer transport protein ExbD